MDRKAFLRSCGIFGAGSCFFPYAVGKAAAALEDDPKSTPCDERMKFAQKWVRRFFDSFDKYVDEKERKETMESCGRSCFLGSIEGRKIATMDIDTFIEAINKSTGEVAATRDGNVVDFRYIGDPKGLKVEDGYCLCPFVESGPDGLSGTYCDCSVGYVSEMFRTYTGRAGSVELLESLKRGGKACRFRITLSA